MVIEIELDTTEAEKAIDKLLEKAQKLEETLERCVQDENVSDIVVVLDEKADDSTANIVNLETKGIKEVPLWTQQQWYEHIYGEIEEKYGEKTANFFVETPNR